MKIFVHRHHRVEDRARHAVHSLSPGMVYDLPDDFIQPVVDAYPSRLCVVEHELDPSSHVCPITEAVAAEDDERRRRTADHAMIEQPPENRMMDSPTRLSPQRRRTQTQAKKRSRRARVEASADGS